MSFLSLLQITGFVALVIAFSSTIAGQTEVVILSTRTNSAIVSNKDKSEAPRIKPEERAPSNSVSTSSRTGEQIDWLVISGGATNSHSTKYALMGTVGQSAVGLASSTNYQIHQGFWQNFGSECCDLAGDSNDDGSVNVADLTYTVAFMFKGGSLPACLADGDVNADGTLDIADLTYRVAFMFQGGPKLICGPR